MARRLSYRSISVAAAALGLVCLSACSNFTSPVKVPSEYKSYFTVAAKRCPSVLTPWGLAAQAQVESGFDPAAESPAGAQGIMQVMPDTWKFYGTDATGDGRENPFSAADSIATSAIINCALAKEVESIPGNKTELRLAAYNAGIGAVQRYKGVPPYPETENYVRQVQKWTEHFEAQFKTASPSSNS